MVQAMGALLILIGCIMWHVASSNKPVHNVSDVWNDMLHTMSGTES